MMLLRINAFQAHLVLQSQLKSNAVLLRLSFMLAQSFWSFPMPTGVWSTWSPVKTLYLNSARSFTLSQWQGWGYRRRLTISIHSPPTSALYTLNFVGFPPWVSGFHHGKNKIYFLTRYYDWWRNCALRLMQPKPSGGVLHLPLFFHKTTLIKDGWRVLEELKCLCTDLFIYYCDKIPQITEESIKCVAAHGSRG